MCPANIATGGTDSIHRLVSELCKCGADAKILYVGCTSDNPQPKEYEHYQCRYITELPKDYNEVLIFPEIWANRVVETAYKDCKVVVNWQGVDVYSWNTPRDKQGLFLQRKDCMHITNLEYGMSYLRSLNLKPIKISDCLNDIFFETFSQEQNRKDIVLYNPVRVKMTNFQETVMSKCTTELGIRFQMLEGYTQSELIDVFRHSKLYIDFGVFSGRERLPREALMCGCCILTSKLGASAYHEDNTIPDKYKVDSIGVAIQSIKYILHNYELCKLDFDESRELLRQDRQNYASEVKNFYEILCNNPNI